MKQWLAAYLFCGICFLNAGADEKIFSEPPVVTVGKIQDMKIDGIFSESEKKATAGMYGFCHLRPNTELMTLFDAEARFQVGTDGENLYIGVESEVGEHGILERSRKGRGGMKAFLDDSFEFVIVPDPNAKMPNIYHIITNNKGSYTTSARQDGSNVAWNPVFESKGIVKNKKWTYEIAFPLSQFGISKWDEGKSIGLRVCRNWRGVKRNIGDNVQTSWSQIRGAFFESDNIPLIKLQTSEPIVRFENLITNGAPDLKVSLFNPSSTSIKIKTISLHKPENSQSVNDVASLELSPGEKKIIELRLPQVTETEKVQSAFKVMREDNSTIYHRAFKWKLMKRDVFEKAASDSEKIAFRYAFYAETNRMFLQIDASMLKDTQNLKGFNLEVTGKTGGVVATSVMPQLKNKTSELLWQLPPLKEFTQKHNPSGEYTLTLKINDDKITRNFERKIFDWEGNKIGISDRLIPPFTPITVNDNQVSTILREHTLSDTGLWQQVKADGENLLVDGGIKLLATVGGKVYTVKGNGIKFTQKNDTCVIGSADWQAQGISGRTDFRFEFDGMMKFNLTVNAGTQVDSLKMVIPLDEKNATLFHAVTDGLRFNYGGKTPQKWNSSMATKMNLQTSYVPYIWLGVEGRGFSVYGENDKGWEISTQVFAQTMELKNGKAELVFNLFAKPVKLDSPRTITMAFQATPVKPMIPNWRKHQASWGLDSKIVPYTDYAITFYGSSLCIGGITGSDDLMPRDNDLSLWEAYGNARKNRQVPEGFLDKWITKYRPEVASKLPSYRREISYGLHTASKARPNSVTFYTNGRGQRIDIPEARTFLDNWFREEFQGSRERTPAYGASLPYSVDPVKSYRDYAVICYKRMIESGACDNIYWDDVFPASNLDRSGAEAAYVTADGKFQPSTGIFNMRELIRRAALLQLELDRKPNNMVHMTNTAVAPICAFAQQNLDWEDNLGTNPFQQRYTREYIRAVSIGRQFGNLPAALGLVNNSGGNAAVEWCLRTGAGVTLTHEIQWSKGAAAKDYSKVLLAFYQFGYGDDKLVNVHNYWERNYPVIVNGGENASILLKKGNEAYLVVSNYGDDADFTAAISGMDKIEAVNGETGEKLLVNEKKIKFNLKKYDFIFIKVKGL